MMIRIGDKLFFGTEEIIEIIFQEKDLDALDNMLMHTSKNTTDYCLICCNKNLTKEDIKKWRESFDYNEEIRKVNKK